MEKKIWKGEKLNLKQTTLQRAQDIISTANPKFKWKYFINENTKNKLYFWCENCYRLYFIEFTDNEQSLAIISHFIEMLKNNNFKISDSLPV